MLDTVDYNDPKAPEKFVESLRSTGFGVLCNHPIEQGAVDSIYRHWQSFFDGESKLDYQFNADRYDGFFPAQQAEAAKGRLVRDIKEYYHCLLYTSPSPRDRQKSRMPSSA